MKTDEEIIQLVLAGEQQLFEEILSRYEQKVYCSALKSVNNRDDALDITQDIFVKAYKNLDKFKGESTFATWFYRLSMNTIFDWIRKKQRYEERLKELENNELINYKENYSQDLCALDDYLSTKVFQAVSKLSLVYRETIYQFYYEGKSYAEIAEMMSVSKKTVESRLYRGRNMIKQILNKQDKDQLRGNFDEALRDR